MKPSPRRAEVCAGERLLLGGQPPPARARLLRAGAGSHVIMPTVREIARCAPGSRGGRRRVPWLLALFAIFFLARLAPAQTAARSVGFARLTEATLNLTALHFAAYDYRPLVLE